MDCRRVKIVERRTVMGDVWLIAGCLFGFGVLYTAVLIILAKKTEATPRPDLEESRREQ